MSAIADTLSACACESFNVMSSASECARANAVRDERANRGTSAGAESGGASAVASDDDDSESGAAVAVAAMAAAATVRLRKITLCACTAATTAAAAVRVAGGRQGESGEKTTAGPEPAVPAAAAAGACDRDGAVVGANISRLSSDNDVHARAWVSRDYASHRKSCSASAVVCVSGAHDAIAKEAERSPGWSSRASRASRASKSTRCSPTSSRGCSIAR